MTRGGFPHRSGEAAPLSPAALALIARCEVRAAQPVELGVEIAEAPALQQRAVVCYASPTVTAGRLSRRAPCAGMWASGHSRCVHAGAGMLPVAAAVGADDFPRCRHARSRRGRYQWPPRIRTAAPGAGARGPGGPGPGRCRCPGRARPACSGAASPGPAGGGPVWSGCMAQAAAVTAWRRAAGHGNRLGAKPRNLSCRSDRSVRGMPIVDAVQMCSCSAVARYVWLPFMQGVHFP